MPIACGKLKACKASTVKAARSPIADFLRVFNKGGKYAY
jgi:hypothetical protein